MKTAPVHMGTLAAFCAAATLALFLACTPAHADAALRAADSVECLADGQGKAKIEATTLENLTDYDMLITGATAPSGLSWTCDAVGKTIPARSSIRATWSASEPLPESLAGLLSNTNRTAIGEATYQYSYEKPIPALSGTIAISGKRTTTSTLSAQASGTPADAALSWQWYKDDAPIEGATSQTYTLLEDDDGHDIECRASDANGLYTGDIRTHAGTIEFAYYLGYTMAETKAIATDIAKNGTASRYYKEMAQGLEDDAVGTMRLRNGEIYHFRLGGILHDEATSGGKAGLTFIGRHAMPKSGQMNSTDTNVGGWKASEIRQSLNAGTHWQLFSDEFQQSICPTNKTTNNENGKACATAQVSDTSDKVWLLSVKEVAGTLESKYSKNGPALDQEGTQYDCFKPYYQSTADRPADFCFTMVIYKGKWMASGSNGMFLRLRSITNFYDTDFYCMSQVGNTAAMMEASYFYSITPGWCMGEAN